MSKKKNIKKWAWVLTGSGHFFTETIDLINKLKEVDLFVSKAAEEVLVMYKKKGKISETVRIYQDNSASSASVGKFYQGAYHTVVMAPTSSNTVAKCVYGISDSLATNIFAQSGKCKVDCIFFPCDTAPELKTMAPSGMVDVYPREIDLENVKKLKKFQLTEVVESFKQLEEKVLERKRCLRKFYS